MWRRKRNSSPRACLVSGKEERAGWKGDVPRRGPTHVTLVEGNVKDEKGWRTLRGGGGGEGRGGHELLDGWAEAGPWGMRGCLDQRSHLGSC